MRGCRGFGSSRAPAEAEARNLEYQLSVVESQHSRQWVPVPCSSLLLCSALDFECLGGCYCGYKELLSAEGVRISVRIGLHMREVARPTGFGPSSRRVLHVCGASTSRSSPRPRTMIRLLLAGTLVLTCNRMQVHVLFQSKADDAGYPPTPF